MKRLQDLVEEDREGGPRLARPRWQKGVVLLCSKCSGEQPGADGPEAMPSMGTWELRCWLKDRMIEEGLWPPVRVLTTSCMGICSDGEMTCSFGGELTGSGDARCVLLDPARDKEWLLDQIRALAAEAE